jgi:hypothetical protein
VNLQDKTLYHQIHPLKLFTDWSTGIAALVLFWQHNLLPALLLAFIPSILVSFVLVRFANLERYQGSAFGKYIRSYMTRRMEIMRFAGYALMAVGAWYHLVWLIPLGLLVVVVAWLRGVIFPGSTDRARF